MLQSRFPRHPLSRPKGGSGEPLGAQKSPGPARRDGLCRPRGRATRGYATANGVRAEADTLVVKCPDPWHTPPGHYPTRLLFASRAATYAKLSERTRRGVGFITIRRRGSAMLRRIRALPAQQWHPCQVTQAKGKRRSVRYGEATVTLDGYQGALRQIVFDGLGHESPTFVLTNDLPQRLTARQVIQTYARRNHVEHSLGEKITFFHPRLSGQRSALKCGLRPDPHGGRRYALSALGSSP